MTTENIMASGLLIGVLAMLFYTPYCMAAGIDRLNTGKRGFKLKCAIPFVNMISAEVGYYGKIGIKTISGILFLVGIILKVCTWLFMHGNTGLNMATTILVLALFVFCYIGNCVFVYTVISDANILPMPKLILFTLIYPIGQWYVQKGVAVVVEKRQKQEATFKG